ncbi:SDR family NAD(P)-dependent oxidoreductase [Lentibacillus sediminis]|uniref:SDR family NAD(P)-dependent oxidoreductase n=1 Tax=Lentibacillus sediminis TaxID=1940529 RepID=UPI000C1C4926|nr:SDR family NAD(P)-dependent oxidoreductase [Lentibacillus sediminis]
MARLEGKTAIITGAAGGIGKNTAELFLKEGAKVLLVDMNEDALKEAKSELKDFGQVDIATANVAKEDDVKAYVRKAKDLFGSVDIFFNNAGIIGEVAPIIELGLEDFQKVLAVNTEGVFLGLKHVLKVMSEQGSGSVINTSSIDAMRGSPEQVAYSASKHAVVGLTKTAALEMAEKGVRVNSIHPAPVDTSMMRGVESVRNPDNPEGVKETYMGAIPLNKYAETKDIANLVLFLASDESKFITGSQYRVDGGMGAL